MSLIPTPQLREETYRAIPKMTKEDTKKGRYWQTIDCNFEKFMSKFNLNKGQELDPDSFEMENYSMSNLTDRYRCK